MKLVRKSLMKRGTINLEAFTCNLLPKPYFNYEPNHGYQTRELTITRTSLRFYYPLLS